VAGHVICVVAKAVFCLVMKQGRRTSPFVNSQFVLTANDDSGGLPLAGR
jgi:hypothetical protein